MPHMFKTLLKENRRILLFQWSWQQCSYTVWLWLDFIWRSELWETYVQYEGKVKISKRYQLGVNLVDLEEQTERFRRFAGDWMRRSFWVILNMKYVATFLKFFLKNYKLISHFYYVSFYLVAFMDTLSLKWYSSWEIRYISWNKKQTRILTIFI